MGESVGSSEGPLVHYCLSTSHPSLSGDVPYVVALVTLDEGPQMMTNIVGCPPEQVKIGMPVQVTFEDWTEEISVPKFKPV